MNPLDKLLDNPAGLLAVVCLVGVVIVANLTLVAMIAGGQLDLSRFRRSLNKEADLWRRSFTAGGQVRQQQAEQLEELHRLVGRLRPPEPNPPDSRDQT